MNNPVNAVDPSGLTSKNIATPFDNIDWRQIRHTLDFNGSTYYSVRDIFEHLGGDVHYSYTTKQANLYLKSYIDRQAYNFELKYNLNDIAVDKHNRRVLADIFEGALSVNGHSQDIPLIYYRGSVYIIPAILTETASTLCGEVEDEGGTGEADYNVITFEDEIHGTINGNDKTLYPNKNWYAYEYRSKEGETGMTDDGKYEIAVGPRIIAPNYPDDGRIWASDLDGFNMNVDVVLENKKTGETKILSCYVTDIKAHTYNKYNGNGDNVSFEIDNGQVQTGVAYPNSWNFKHETPFSEYNSDGSVIEFIIKPTDFSPNDYRLKEIRTFN